MTLASRRLDLDVHTSRQAQLVQRLDRLGRGLHDVDHPLVRANLELLPSLLVDVRTGQDRVPFDPRRQRNRSVHFRIGPLGRVHDLLCTLIQDRVIVGFHPDANDFTSGTSHQYNLLSG